MDISSWTGPIQLTVKTLCCLVLVLSLQSLFFCFLDDFKQNQVQKEKKKKRKQKRLESRLGPGPPE